MAFKHYEGGGSIFRNEKCDPERNQATHTGSCTIGGVEYWISAWVKEGTKGKYFSLNFQEKAVQTKDEPKVPAEGFEDDIPF